MDPPIDEACQRPGRADADILDEFARRGEVSRRHSPRRTAPEVRCRRLSRCESLLPRRPALPLASTSPAHGRGSCLPSAAHEDACKLAGAVMADRELVRDPVADAAAARSRCRGVETEARRPGRPLRDADSPSRSPYRCQPPDTRRMRSATCSGDPTSAVPAPPRTRPTPAHRLGATTSLSRRPPCSSAMRRWPTKSISLRNRCCATSICSSVTLLISRSAAAQASSSVSRTMKCRRMPKRSVRPAEPPCGAPARSSRQPAPPVRPRSDTCRLASAARAWPASDEPPK